MKRKILIWFFVDLFFGLNLYLCYSFSNLMRENQLLYQKFEQKKLVDVDGTVNLGSILSKKQNLEKEIQNLFGADVVELGLYQEEIENQRVENISLRDGIAELSSLVTTLENQKGELNNQYSILKNKYDRLYVAYVARKNLENGTYQGFPLINQYPSYPTGCESVALTMLLRYYGVQVSPDQVIQNLRKESLPYYENGIKFGGNPEVSFVGTPYSSSGYGVYEKPIAEVANLYKSGVQVRNEMDFNEVLSLVKEHHPVIVWVSMGLSIPYISDSWVYKPTMETIYWKAGEHALILIGYSNDTLIVADPIGGSLKSYSVSLVQERYQYFGRKAVFYYE